MRRREILVFISAFVVVLLGGAALAQVGAFSDSSASETGVAAATLSEPAPTETTTVIESNAYSNEAADDTAAEEMAEPSAAVADTDGDKPEPTDPPKEDEPPADPPKDEEPPADPPKEEEPPQDADTTPPPLEILFPKNEQHFEDKVVAFEGTTEPGARVFGNAYEADVDSNGNWRVVLVLSPGGNLVTFKAKDAAGNVTEEAIKVFLDVTEETTKEFTAHQKWEVVDGYPAKNKYYGTGTPGTKVWVGSEYGSGSGMIDGNGEWLFYVEFPEAPCNESFKVVVESGEHRREFTMKYVCSETKFSANQEYIENTSLWTKFYGTGTPGDTIWAASEYGTEQTTVGSDGKWYLKLHFNENVPPNEKIKVVIESSSDDRVEFWFKWVVEEEKQVEFSANQKFGSSTAEVPWDKFWGTAQPGSTIEVVSPYGGGTTTADASGNWLIEVEFPEAPLGEAFTVVIESSDGGRATFAFIRLEA